jgi:putative transposase
MEKGRVDRHLASGLPYDMTTTVTTEEGQVCVFIAVDHCTSECIGIHASKSGNRFEALEPLRQGVREHFGGVEREIAMGLAIRHDHGSAYMSDAFQQELAFLGMASSPSFVREPEGNGIAERFIRTLKRDKSIGPILRTCFQHATGG